MRNTCTNTSALVTSATKPIIAGLGNIPAISKENSAIKNIHSEAGSQFISGYFSSKTYNGTA